MAKVVAVIQARIGSTRMPAKILLPLGELAVAERVYQATIKSDRINEAIVAIPDSYPNDILAEFLKSKNIPFIRGSEENVLSRYIEAARHTEADYIVRITSDCPFISADVVSSIVDVCLSAEEIAYVSNTIARSYPRGLDCEVVKVEALAIASREASHSSELEHVTPFIWKRPEKFMMRQVKLTDDFSSYRLTLDTIEDYIVISRIASLVDYRLINWQELKNIISTNEDIFEYNREILQKGI